jgi:intermediate cleaving peptidase 55
LISLFAAVSSLFSSLTGLFRTHAKQQQSAFTFASHAYPDSNLNTSTKPSKNTPSDSDVMSTSKNLSPLIQELRVTKSEAEIKIMRQAGEISGKAFIEVP